MCQISTINKIWVLNVIHAMLNLCTLYPYSTFLSHRYVFPIFVKLTLALNSQVRITAQLSSKMHELSITNNMKSSYCIQYKVFYNVFIDCPFTILVNVYTWQMCQFYKASLIYHVMDCFWPISPLSLKHCGLCIKVWKWHY